MRIAVVQFAPKIGQVQQNLETARTLCSQLTPHSVDLVCLPEMIFTGYAFPDAKSILPYLEQPAVGPTSLFCAELASRLRCHVAAGYPERLTPEEAKATPTREWEGSEVQPVGANSAVLYGPDGQLVGNYRKMNLFTTDMTWAKAGTAFVTFNLPPPLGTVTFGICNDLNVQPPSEWTIEEGPYEIASHAISTRSNLLVLLNAWLDSGDEDGSDMDRTTVNHWAARLRPLWVKPLSLDQGSHARDLDSSPGDETIVVVCDRCGKDNDTAFAGSSLLFSMIQRSGRPTLLGAMKREEQGLAVWTVPAR